MSNGELIATILPVFTLFIALVFMMSMGSYILPRENTIIYILMVLTMAYYIIELVQVLYFNNRSFPVCR